jgi:hypothetical protein
VLRRRPLLLAALAAALVAAGLLLASCGGDDGAATTESVTTTSTETATDTTETTTTTTEEERPVVVRVVVAGGVPKGGIVRGTVSKGDRVVLVVESDVADEVHVHGYDLSREVTPGAAARIAFVAKLPGRFEVELEERGVQIADLTVEP